MSQQIVVLDNFSENDGAPARKFFEGLAELLGGRFIAIPALYVDFSDDALAANVQGWLSEAGELWYPVHGSAEPVSNLEALQRAVQAVHETAAQLADAQVHVVPGRVTDIWQSTGPTDEDLAAWREAVAPADDPVELAIEGYIDSVVACDGSDSALEAVEVAEERASAAIWDQAPAAPVEEPSPAKPGRGKYPRKQKKAQQPKAEKKPVEPRACAACGEMFVPKRDGNYCYKKECQREMQRIYNRAHYKKMARMGQEPVLSEIDGLPVPHPADPDPSEPATHTAAIIHGVMVPKRSSLWVVEDGRLAGKMLTPEELRKALDGDDIVAGQHVQNSEFGKCRVIKFRGTKGHRLAVKALFGKHADQLVDLASLQ